MNNEFTLIEATWASYEPQLRAIREQVFVVEQHVPTYVEWDEYDITATHLLALDAEQKPVGCARILDSGRVGRMGVLREWRGRGLGRALLDKAIEICKQSGHKQITLSAQTHALKFYQKAGFVVTSEAYIDVNIWHVDMRRVITD